MASRSKTELAQERRDPVTYVNGVPILFQGEPPLRPLEWFGNVPLLYDDDDEVEMGESNLHAQSNVIIYVCLCNHFAGRPQFHVFLDMNLYYRPEGLPESRPTPFATPDTMVVEAYERLDESLTSYTIGEHGPAPRLTVEVLSRRTYQPRDLQEKVQVYSYLGVEEYILVDVTGKFLPQKLLLKRLQADGTYKDERDADGGVTSKLGFRIIMDDDSRIRIINTATGHRYVRPLEAEAAATQAWQATERARQLEDELARLREIIEKQQKEKNGSP
ncbi:MAG TPA: Uma2 family endonuclease [Gemmataceae bacterium]|jgi:Uma2 family endonuclease|nr:Uma2 family endonuclease [Gemmataceae bacterium]